MTKAMRGLAAIFLAAVMILMFLPVIETQDVYADTSAGTLLSGDDLNGLKVRIRPAGSFKPLAINDDGGGKQNCVHLYYQGKSSQFYLQKADADSYFIYFYPHYTDENPKMYGDCVFDLEDKGGYSKEEQVVHVVPKKDTKDNKRWQFYRQDDGSYYVRNKRSGKYWSLKDLDKAFENNTKLVQRTSPLKWDIEIVSKNNDQFKSKVKYDSRNFVYNKKTVSSNNWMGALPDGLKITDISLPGTHDSGSCHVHKSQDSKSTQRYHIDEMLNAGVRHLDIRTGLNKDANVNVVRIVHSDAHARNHKGNDLLLEEAMDWIVDFLKTNPTETIVIQPKMDKEGDECERATYTVLKEYAEGKGEYIWAGDHVPTLGEVRGKILIISRLNSDNIGGDRCYDIERNGKTLQWALDCDNYNKSGGKESKNHHAAHTVSGTNYDVWVQDNFRHGASDKKRYIKRTLYGNESENDDGDTYTNGTQYHYDQSKIAGKDGWHLNYTSASFGIGGKNAFDLCKEIHQWLYDRSYKYNRKSDTLIYSGSYTGIMAFDYVDGLMSTFLYRTNFDRQYTTIHYVNADGEKVAEPMVLQVANHEKADKLLNNITRDIIKGHLKKTKYNSYQFMAATNGDYLTSKGKVADQDELDDGAAAVRSSLEGGVVPSDMYVRLSEPINTVEIDEIGVPECGQEVTGDNPQVDVYIDQTKKFRAAVDDSGETMSFIAKSKNSEEPFEGRVEGGKMVTVYASLAPRFGYNFAGSCTVSVDGNEVDQDYTLSDGLLKIKTQVYVRHCILTVDEEEEDAPRPAACEEDGIKDYVKCYNPLDGTGCGKKFFICNPEFDPEVSIDAAFARIFVEATDIDLRIPALGHKWLVDDTTDEEGWKVTRNSTELVLGEMTRECERCDKTETRPIPYKDHEHVTTHHEAEPGDLCTDEGTVEYWVCDQGENPCNCYFSDEQCTNQLTEEELIAPPGEHDWRETDYSTITDGWCILVKAARVCRKCGEGETEKKWANEIDREPPTCTEDGYLAGRVNFKNPAFHYDIPVTTYPAIGHFLDNGVITREPTCVDEGVRTRTCLHCGEDFDESVPVDPNAHDIDIEVNESTDTATCEEPGTVVQYEICSLCGHVTRKVVDSEPLEHLFGEPTYEWADDNSTVTATRICQRDECGVEDSETTEAAKEIVWSGSFEDEGMIRYDAQFDNVDFDTQEKTVAIPKVAGIRLSQASYTYDGKKKTPSVELTDADGITLDASNYSVEYSDNTNAGEAAVKVTLKGDYYEGSKTVTFRIRKAANPLKIKARKAVVKSSKLKKKNQTLKVTKVIKYKRKLNDKKLFKLSSAKKGKKSFKKYFKISKTTGKVTIKKNNKMKKGTYKVKVKVKAAGNANFKASAVKTVTFKIRIK